MSLYRVVLAEGLRSDLTTYLNKELLVEQWPVLRRLISRNIRAVWEMSFPDLGRGFAAKARISATSTADCFTMSST